jgi:hypothetical protein
LKREKLSPIETSIKETEMTRMPPLLWLLLQRLRRCGGAARRRFLMMHLADLDPLPLGPGWFDSSWELENGLEVCEGNVLDAQLAPLFEAALRERVSGQERSVAQRSENLIEFELIDVGARPPPLEHSRPPRLQRAELELALA